MDRRTALARPRHQVHKAKLRDFTRRELSGFKCVDGKKVSQHVVEPGQSAWGVCNNMAVSMGELQRLNKGEG